MTVGLNIRDIELPRQVLLPIFAKLTLAEIGSLRRVSRSWNVELSNPDYYTKLRGQLKLPQLPNISDFDHLKFFYQLLPRWAIPHRLEGGIEVIVRIFQEFGGVLAIKNSPNMMIADCPMVRQGAARDVYRLYNSPILTITFTNKARIFSKLAVRFDFRDFKITVVHVTDLPNYYVAAVALQIDRISPIGLEILDQIRKTGRFKEPVDSPVVTRIECGSFWADLRSSTYV